MDDPSCSLLNCENQLWEPNRNDDVRELYLDASGKSSTTTDIYTRDIIDEVGGTAIGGNIYKSFQEKMDGLKAGHLINDWESAPYDWRLSIDDILGSGKKDGDNLFYTKATSSPYIIQELKRLAASSRTGKVTIVAHSNGGLVAKALMQKLGPDAARFVDKIIFVAVPQSGTPQAIGALLNGFSQEIPDAWYLLPVNGTVLSTSNARALAENMQSAYNLLPSQAYFTGSGSNVTTPLVEFAPGTQTALFRNMYGSQIDRFDALQAFLRGIEGRMKPDASNVTYPNVLNPTLLTAAFAEHNLLDAWTPPAGVQVYQIAGWGIDTAATITYKQGSYFHCWGVTPCVDYDVALTEDGDGTVVVPSALAMSTSTAGVGRLWLNIQTYNSGLTINRDHKDILEVSNLLDFIDDVITKTNKPLGSYTYLSTSTPPTVTPIKKLRYFLHSPLSLDLYDDQGNHTGISTTTGMIDNQIPGAYYRTFGEVKYITAPATSPLHLILNGQASGYFTLDVQEVTGDTITATTSFVDIPTATSTKVTMNFSDGTIVNAGALTVDEDGNGTPDFALASKLNDVVALPHYSFSGFLQPINDVAYHAEQSASIFKGGSTIPVKFQLKSATGTLVQATILPMWLAPQKLSPMSASPNEASAGDTGTTGSTFKWDATGQQYIYNWSTKGLVAGYWYKIAAKLDDGTIRSVVVGVR